MLGRIEAFRGVPAALLDELASEFRPAQAGAGEVIVRQGDIGDQLFLVEEGDLEVSSEIGGRRKRLGALGPGDVFGEFALVSRSPRMATVTALSPVRLLTLSAAHFDEWMSRSPELATSMREVMRRREITNALKALQ